MVVFFFFLHDYFFKRSQEVQLQRQVEALANSSSMVQALERQVAALKEEVEKERQRAEAAVREKEDAVTDLQKRNVEYTRLEKEAKRDQERIKKLEDQLGRAGREIEDLQKQVRVTHMYMLHTYAQRSLLCSEIDLETCV